ncbi:uncharacterized protein BCR38DRAFT_428833 [Pseudomassariella vexata]|uniref:Uncharacterized protein n=1 Tax=Pseudomassariella vexata TaxID=1141098 RepID=A0A1Y2E356_9PEZI|nr:uncharacterized protein BCR38DRAFT_428833 [Pseudomassariella vexata]ORY65949.1 hypothetical protein BCR38DRAFT_428833 [Pseudomassariella vexata]
MPQHPPSIVRWRRLDEPHGRLSTSTSTPGKSPLKDPLPDDSAQKLLYNEVKAEHGFVNDDDKTLHKLVELKKAEQEELLEQFEEKKQANLRKEAEERIKSNVKAALELACPPSYST